MSSLLRTAVRNYLPCVWSSAGSVKPFLFRHHFRHFFRAGCIPHFVFAIPPAPRSVCRPPLAADTVRRGSRQWSVCQSSRFDHALAGPVAECNHVCKTSNRQTEERERRQPLFSHVGTYPGHIRLVSPQSISAVFFFISQLLWYLCSCTYTHIHAARVCWSTNQHYERPSPPPPPRAIEGCAA